MKPITFDTIEDVPLLAVSLGSISINKTGSWRTVRPVYQNNIPPCSVGCPAGERIPEYFALVSKGRYEEAWRTILEDNPLPGVCGRVCYHPCETPCNRAFHDEPIAIHSMERFVADKNFGNHEPMTMLEEKKNLRVAVIGSGPSGLSCAYQLARRGYAVTIFEADKKPGGMLRSGIPSYRLPRAVLDKEIGDILRLGVELRCATRFGTDIAWDELRAFNAVFVAVGAHGSRRLGIPGEDDSTVRSGLGFLREVSEGKKPALGERVAVIGGGNTAIDVARTAARFGRSVTIAYRRSRAEMPAVPEEIEEAIREGVTILYLTAPARIIRENGGAIGIECIGMTLGEPDSSGRRAPVPISNSEFILDADTIFTAIGEEPVLGAFEGFLSMHNGRLRVDDRQRTNVAAVFAGGDSATNPLGTVVDAIRTGRDAALSIHAALSSSPLPDDRPGRVIGIGDILTTYFPREMRPMQPRISFDRALGGFHEVNEGLAEGAALREATRCFSCGVCNECDNCISFCPDVSVRRRDDGYYEIDLDHCKGCGICVEECPREAMLMQPELR